MITPEQFQEIGETLLPLLDDLTEWIARDMIERFMIRFGRGEKKLLTGTDEWQAWVLKQAGGNLDEIQKALAKSTGKSQQEIAKIFKDSGIQAAKADAEAAAVTFSGLSPSMMAIITDAYERTVGEISNITRTTAGATNQAFIDICDAAASRRSSPALPLPSRPTARLSRRSRLPMAARSTNLRFPTARRWRATTARGRNMTTAT